MAQNPIVTIEMENGDTIKIVFNRMVDWSQVETLVVNDVEISVQ